MYVYTKKWQERERRPGTFSFEREEDDISQT